MRAQPIEKGPTRTVSVFNRGKNRVEQMTTTAHQRLCLMHAALDEGLEQSPGVTHWPRLSPLKPAERDGVRSEVTRLLTLSPADRSAELILMKAEGNIP